jgi:uncharacterized caspase-like protein
MLHDTVGSCACAQEGELAAVTMNRVTQAVTGRVEREKHAKEQQQQQHGMGFSSVAPCDNTPASPRPK